MYKKIALSMIAGLSTYSGYKYYKNNVQNKVQNKVENKVQADLSKLLWVETDLEPDDILAIDVLRKKREVYAYVCGEGNVDKKMNRLSHYYGQTPAQLFIKGKGSDKDFPEPYDSTDVSKPNANLKTANEYMSELTTFSNAKGSTMVIIKPPREIYEQFLLNPTETKKLLSNMDCYMYGSFNLRSLKANKEQLKDFLSSFRCLYIFETHYGLGSKNSVNPDIFKAYSSLANAKHFTEISKQWNDYIVTDCKDTCNSIINKTDDQIVSLDKLPEEILSKLDDNQKARYHRNYKCYEDVSKYNENQFVMADIGLALCFEKELWTPVTIDFDDKGYTQLTKTDFSNAYTVFATETLKSELLDDLEKQYSTQ
jgi:hypothetical protein